jgi:hypothetical protein
MIDTPGDGPRMSIVMPNYNHGHLIAEALAAISSQTRPPLEVIVVDDGSTDDSLSRLQTLVIDRPWLRIHRLPENRGVSHACNAGLTLVRGDFVLFSAADDNLAPDTVARAHAAAAAFPHTGIVFSDPAEMRADGSAKRVMPFDLPPGRRHYSPGEFVALMQHSFFYFHVSSVWFDVGLLRALGGLRPELYWHADIFAAYAAAFERGATYEPGAVAYFRSTPGSYSTGRQGAAQVGVLRAWLAVTRESGWEGRRAAFIAAAVWPEYSVRGLRVLLSDPGYITPRLAGRLARLVIWTKAAPLVNAGLRERLRRLRTRYRRSRSLPR